MRAATPLREADVDELDAAVEQLLEEDVEALGGEFHLGLHEPGHRAQGEGGDRAAQPWALPHASHEIAPVVGEYERTSMSRAQCRAQLRRWQLSREHEAWARG